MYNLLQYSDDYLITSESLWQYFLDEPTLTNADAPDNFPSNSALFKYKQK